MNMAEIGLMIIALAWLVQLVFSLKGKKEIHPWFISCYMLGVLLLVISAYMAGSPVSYFELGTLVAAGIVLIANIVKK